MRQFFYFYSSKLLFANKYSMNFLLAKAKELRSFITMERFRITGGSIGTTATL